MRPVGVQQLWNGSHESGSAPRRPCAADAMMLFRGSSRQRSSKIAGSRCSIAQYREVVTASFASPWKPPHASKPARASCGDGRQAILIEEISVNVQVLLLLQQSQMTTSRTSCTAGAPLGNQARRAWTAAGRRRCPDPNC